MTLGEQIRQLREAAGMVQVDLAAAAGITQGQLSQYEADLVRPKLDVLGRLADALGKSLIVTAERIEFVEPDAIRLPAEADSS